MTKDLKAPLPWHVLEVWGHFARLVSEELAALMKVLQFN